MPISVTCPGCGKRLKAKDSLAGRMVPCPACGTKLVIGSPEDIAAALLRDDAGPPAGEPEAPAPPEDHAPPERPAEPPRRPRPKPVVRRKPGPAAAASSLPPLTANEPPFWLRHLHWLLVLALIPLAVSLLEASQEEDFLERLSDTLQQAPEESRARVRQVLAQMEEEGGSLDKIFAALPDHKLQGAWLPRDSWNHWAFTGGAALLFFLFLLALCAEGSARPQHLLAVGLFTATIGLLFLFLVQALAEWSQGMIIIPRGVIGILLLVVQLIGWSYRAANDPSCGFLLSLVGYTLGVGLC